MFNLVKKDFILSKKMNIFVVIYALFISAMGLYMPDYLLSNILYVLGMIILIFITVIYTNGYDDKYKSEIVLNSFPIDRRNIVRGKYLTLIIYIIIACSAVIIFTNIITMVGIIDKGVSANIWNAIYAANISLIFYSIYYPIYFWLGEGLRSFNYILWILMLAGPTILGKSMKSLEKIGYLEKVYENNEELTIKVTAAKEKGLVAYYNGVRIFIPSSQIDIKYVEDKESLVGTEMAVKLIDFSKENLSKIVASRKILLEEAKAKKEAITWDSLQVGDIVKAEIKRFTNFGAFAEVDGVDGLIHLSQISWSHIKSCEEVLKIGQIVDVKIINLDKETKKLSLSIKELTPEPWSVVDEKYSEGSAVLGKVVRINDFGAFVELEPGIDGLVHISKISHDHIKHPSEVLSIGQEVKCIILSIDKENRKIALSIKDAE